MDIEMINNASKLEKFIKVYNLPLDEPNLISQLELVNTKYGQAILAHVPGGKCFLPKRMTEPIKKNLENFETNKYVLIYRGRTDQSVNVTIELAQKFSDAESQYWE